MPGLMNERHMVNVEWQRYCRNVYEIERSPIEKHVLFKAYIIFREVSGEE